MRAMAGYNPDNKVGGFSGNKYMVYILVKFKLRTLLENYKIANLVEQKR